MHNLEQLKIIKTQVRDLAHSSRQAEYRRNDETSIGVSVRGLRGNRIGVEVRDNTPTLYLEGYELYPYKGLHVVFPIIARPSVKEIFGIKRRDARGILVDWTDGSKVPQREMEGMPIMDIDVESYVNALDVDPKAMHDKYGRTPDEQEKETAIIAEFGIQTGRLLNVRHPGRHHPMTRNVTTSSVFTTSYGEVTVTERGEKKGIIVVTDATTEPYRKIYQVRRSDKRLGVTVDRGKKIENPASIAAGERLITLLKSLP